MTATPDLRADDPRSIARAISLVEDEGAAGAALIASIFARTGRAFVLGITGAPGAGKSTLVDRLTATLRHRGLTVGIIAIDPTSPFTGGAILGDRVRMGAHAGDPGVFIRSMATRGHLGGLSRATGDAVLVLDAAGKDVVVIETVGVGQAEVDIVRTADASVVLLVPGTGDDVQAMKAGVMEIADVFVVNKADREGADGVAAAVSASLSLRPFAPGEWQPPILKTDAVSGAGVPEVWEALERFRRHAPASGQMRRRARQESRVLALLGERLLAHVREALAPGEIDRAVDAVAAREIDPYSAVDGLIGRVLGR